VTPRGFGSENLYGGAGLCCALCARAQRRGAMGGGARAALSPAWVGWCSQYLDLTRVSQKLKKEKGIKEKDINFI